MNKSTEWKRPLASAQHISDQRQRQQRSTYRPSLTSSLSSHTTPCIHSHQHILRTYAASEYRESLIWQRCGCKKCSSDAEGSSGPCTARRIEDVHSIDNTVIMQRLYIPICATHQQSAAAAAATPRHSRSPPPPQIQPPAINDINIYYVLSPPANIASPPFGSEVAARYCRTTLRAAVVHAPLFTLNMSTILTKLPLASAQHISNP